MKEEEEQSLKAGLRGNRG